MGNVTRRWIAALLLAVLSALMQFTYVRETDQFGEVRADAMKYVMYAYNLKHHGVFSHLDTFQKAPPEVIPPDKLTLPGYAWFLQHFLGEGVPDLAFATRAEHAQAALGVVSTILAFLIACRLLPFAWACAAGLLVATKPQLVVMSGYLITEQLSTTLVLAFVLSTLHAAAPEGRKWQAALAGLFLGLVCLVRPQLQGVPWLVLLAVCLVPRWRVHLRHAAIAGAIFASVVLPWQLRNAHVTAPPGDPDLLAVTIYHGTFPNFMFDDDPATYGAPYRADPLALEHSRDVPAALGHVRDLFAADPKRYVHWYLLGKPGAFLSWSMSEGIGDIFIYPVGDNPWALRPTFIATRTFHYFVHWPLMLFAVVTIVLALWRPQWISKEPARRMPIRLVAALLAYVILLHVFGLPLSRYNLPYQPLEIAMALVGLRATAAWAQSRAGRADPEGHFLT